MTTKATQTKYYRLIKQKAKHVRQYPANTDDRYEAIKDAVFDVLRAMEPLDILGSTGIDLADVYVSRADYNLGGAINNGVQQVVRDDILWELERLKK